MPTVTRRIRAIPFHVFFARYLTFFLDGLLLPGAFPLESLLRQSVSASLEQERTIVLAVHDYFSS